VIRRFLTGLAGLVRVSLRFKLTDPGKLLLVAALVAMGTGSVGSQVPVYHLFAVLSCLLVVAVVVARLFRRRVEVAGSFGRKAVAGHDIVGHFELTNLSALPAYDVSLGFFDLPPVVRQVEAEGMIPCIEPGRAATLDVRLHPLRRGLHDLGPLRRFTTFPFNLVRSGPRGAENIPLLVLPNFRPLDRVEVPVSPRYQPGGIALTSRVGESPEYVGNRDFRPGDSMRRIDPRAWGRLARPVVKEYQEEYYCRVALVMDTFVPRGRRKRLEGFPDLEAAVSLTAAVADAMSRGEYIIDLFAAGPDLYVFRSGRHTAHLENVLEILACVGECRRNPFELIAPALAEELNNISAVLFVLLDWDEPRERLVRAAVEIGCGVRVVIIRDKDPRRPWGAAEDWAGPILHVTPEQVAAGGIEQI